jgi:hypothetical protein
MIFLEPGNLGGLVALIFSIWLVPPVLLVIIALAVSKKNPKTFKTLLILAGVYFLVGLGICGSMML